MKIEILGAGCAKCKRLYENAVEALAETDAEVIKVEDMEKILDYGVMTIPALVADGVVKSKGKVLSPQEILKLLK